MSMKIYDNQKILQPQLCKSSAIQSNPYSKISFKGLENDTVMILKKEEKSLFATLRNMFSKVKSIFSPNETLKSMGISSEQIIKILNIIKTPKKSDFRKNFNAILSKLPKIDDNELLGDFIYYRALASNDKDSEHFKFDKVSFNSFNNIYNSNPSLHNTNSLEVLSAVINYQNYDAKNLSDIEKYIDKDEHANYYLTVLTKAPYGECKQAFDTFKKFTEFGCEKDYLLENFEKDIYSFLTNGENTLSKLIGLKKEGIESEYLLPMINLAIEKADLIRLCNFMKKADDKRSLLGSVDENIKKSDIIELFLEDDRGYNTLNLLNLWGEDTLLNSFNDGFDKVAEYVDNFGDSKCNHKFMQSLIKLVNPTNSEEYIALSDKIKTLKSQFGKVKDDAERNQLIKEINTLSKQRNDIVNNSIKDKTEIINATLVYYGLMDENLNTAKDYEYSNGLVPFMNPKTDEEKLLYKEKLNEAIWRQLEIACPEKLKEDLNFTNNKYLEKMFFLSGDFYDNFNSLIKIFWENQERILLIP